MKNILFAILLLTPCIAISQITDTLALQSKPIDSVSIARAQVSEIYKGLKRGESCEEELQECKSVANTLNNVIQDISTDLKVAAAESEKINLLISAKNSELIKKEVEIQVLKDKVTPWYRHPAVIGIAAFAFGVYVAK